jgi:hypothetical protein
MVSTAVMEDHSEMIINEISDLKLYINAKF